MIFVKRMNEDELMHYGVKGMKWNQHRMEGKGIAADYESEQDRQRRLQKQRASTNFPTGRNTNLSRSQNVRANVANRHEAKRREAQGFKRDINTEAGYKNITVPQNDVSKMRNKTTKIVKDKIAKDRQQAKNSKLKKQQAVLDFDKRIKAESNADSMSRAEYNKYKLGETTRPNVYRQEITYRNIRKKQAIAKNKAKRHAENVAVRKEAEDKRNAKKENSVENWRKQKEQRRKQEAAVSKINDQKSQNDLRRSSTKSGSQKSISRQAKEKVAMDKINRQKDQNNSRRAFVESASKTKPISKAVKNAKNATKKELAKQPKPDMPNEYWQELEFNTQKNIYPSNRKSKKRGH